MKQLTLSLILILSAELQAQITPTGYYDAINGLSDSTLKSNLSLIIRGGTRYEYGINQYHSTNNPPEWMAGDLKAYGTWQALPITDRRPNGTIWDMYSNCTRYFPNKQGDSGCSMNIEHCLPKSWWGGDVNEAYKDLYNLNPSDQRANQQKSNYAPGHVKRGDKFDNGSFRMDKATSSGYGYIVFEPSEEYRGDFARTYFYMATAYEYLTWSPSYSQYISNESYLMFSDSIIKVLLDWHRADPVSTKETCRMKKIEAIQGNRNAFIEYPELVEYIWGNRKGQAVDINSLTPSPWIECDPEPLPPIEPEVYYDTIICLPAITANLVNAISGGSANSGIQSNGSASITMGKNTTDGEISFSGLSISESTILQFRASPYNTASTMQLMVYADDVLLRQINVTVTQETRNEEYYTIDLPVGTQAVRIASVGGSTSQRACMQELYILKEKQPEPGPVSSLAEAVANGATHIEKIMINGTIYLRRNNTIYTVYGTRVR